MLATTKPLFTAAKAFAEAKVPSPWRTRAMQRIKLLVHRGEIFLGKGRRALQKLAIFFTIFGPLKAHFLKLINFGSLDLSKVQFWRKNTLLKVSPLFLLNHLRVCDFVHFYFGFGVILKNPSTRGPHSTLKLSLEHSSSHICFVSLTLTLFSSISLLWM